MFDLTTPRGRIIAAALRLAGERSWSEVTLADIATAADLSLVDLRREFNSKGEILAAFTRAIDDEVLARAPKRSEAQASRDAIFEVVMGRFDLLAPYKPALKSIAAAWPADPALLGALISSQAWMLRAAGIDADGFEGQLRATGLAGVYASVFRDWLQDDDPGLARTMAALDRRLRRGERTLKSIDEMADKVRRCASAFRNARTKRNTGSEPADTSETPPAAPV